jgi:hypothetical protein
MLLEQCDDAKLKNPKLPQAKEHNMAYKKLLVKPFTQNDTLKFVFTSYKDNCVELFARDVSLLVMFVNIFAS